MQLGTSRLSDWLRTLIEQESVLIGGCEECGATLPFLMIIGGLPPPPLTDSSNTAGRKVNRGGGQGRGVGGADNPRERVMTDEGAPRESAA